MTEGSSSGFIEKKIEGSNNLFTDILCIHNSVSGFNTLYMCLHHGKKHVLKALKADRASDEFFKTLLRKEFNIGFQLDHPNICRTLGWEEVSGLGNCILLEYVDGITLKEFIAQGNFSATEGYKIINELCLALQYLHSKQITHRDLKPTNILITHNGNNVKLIDFGLADADDYDIMKEPAGTRYYIAPEVLDGKLALDLRADIYSLGIIIGEMAEKLHDKHLAAISRKCTQQNREKRYGSIAELLRVLNRKPTVHLYKYIGAAIIALIFFSIGIQLWKKDSSVEQQAMPLPVYGNYAISDQTKIAIAEEQLSEDSTDRISKLKEALHHEYPLSEMKQTAVYSKQEQLLLNSYGE